MISIAHGIHIAGVGYSTVLGNNNNYTPTPYRFKHRTFGYVEFSEYPNVCDTESHNSLHDAIIQSHDFILDGTFYTTIFISNNFMPQKIHVINNKLFLDGIFYDGLWMKN